MISRHSFYRNVNLHFLYRSIISYCMEWSFIVVSLEEGWCKMGYLLLITMYYTVYLYNSRDPAVGRRSCLCLGRLAVVRGETTWCWCWAILDPDLNKYNQNHCVSAQLIHLNSADIALCLASFCSLRSLTRYVKSNVVSFTCDVISFNKL